MGCSHQVAHFNTVLRPEEHLIGLLGRHHLFSGFRTYKNALKGISTDVSMQHPNAIDRPLYKDLYKQFGQGESYKEFLKANTLFGVYEPFIPANIEITGNKLLMPNMAYTFKYNHEWRFCAECINEDHENGIIPYFRLEHQLPTMSICHKHAKGLFVFCDPCREQFKGFERHSYPIGTTCRYCGGELEPIDTFVDADIIWLQKSMLRLMKGEVEMPNLELIKQAYQRELGLYKHEGGFTLKQRDFNRSIQKKLDNYFDPRFYRALFNNCDKENQAKRTPSLHFYSVMFKEKVVFSPVVHLLIIRMLFGDIDNIPKIS
ncbi:TniQ family protein [Pseudoalteromonas elyakovii]|nr:TniQ family protein [Pseudoalteromonas elyakovii]